MGAVRKALFASLGLFVASSWSFSQQLYISNEAQSSLELLNLNTGALSTLYNIGAKPDDLILNAQGQLIYSIPSLGEVDLYDPSTGINSVLFSGDKFVRDVAIEPGGATMLVALYTPGKIVRYNFTTQAQTVLTTGLHTCDGIAYDHYGNLYAVADHNTIVQIDPGTGKVLQTLVLEPHSGINGGDGMTYDPYTGELWITHDGTSGYGVEEIFTNASGFTGAFTLYTTPGIKALDGIKSDGKGNLYIGAIHLAVVYNIPTSKVTETFVTDGADGVALVPGTY